MISPLDYGLCVDKNDKFLDEKCVWIVTLSDDTKVYQNDNYPNLPQQMQALEHSHSAWVRLQAYLNSVHLNIIGWQLQFRKSNIVPLQSGVGYVYSRGMIGSLASGGSKKGTSHYHIVGTIKSPTQVTVDRMWFHAPSLVHSETKPTLLADIDPSMVIWNKGT